MKNKNNTNGANNKSNDNKINKGEKPMSNKERILKEQYEEKLQNAIFNNVTRADAIKTMDFMMQDRTQDGKERDMTNAKTALIAHSTVVGIVNHIKYYVAPDGHMVWHHGDIHEVVKVIRSAAEDDCLTCVSLRWHIIDIDKLKLQYEAAIKTPLFRWVADDMFQISALAKNHEVWSVVSPMVEGNAFRDAETIRASQIVSINPEKETIHLCIGAGTSTSFAKEYYEDFIEFLKTKNDVSF